MTRHGEATETLYYNFEPTQLHDTSFVGENRTKRQQVKRKAKRWVDGLEKLPNDERQAILDLIKDRFL